MKNASDNITNVKFSDGLKFLMEDRAVTQADLARALKVSQGAVSNYLNGRVPKAPILQRIADYFGTSTGRLLDGLILDLPPRDGMLAISLATADLKEWGSLSGAERQRRIAMEAKRLKSIESSLKEIGRNPNYLELFWQTAQQLGPASLGVLSGIIRRSTLPPKFRDYCLERLDIMIAERARFERAPMNIETFDRVLSALAQGPGPKTKAEKPQ